MDELGDRQTLEPSRKASGDPPLVFKGRLERDQLDNACELVRSFIAAGGGNVIDCDAGEVYPDAAAVDMLARLQLIACRMGCRIRVTRCVDELRDLIVLMGLDEVVSIPVPGSDGGREGGQMGAKVVHFEIVTNQDAAELQSFYSEVFGWNVQNAEIPDGPPIVYGLVSAEDAGIGGGIGATPDPNTPSHVTFYVQVPDPEATLAEIERRGGTRLMGPDEVAPGTTIALFRDPHGNVVGLSKGE